MRKLLCEKHVVESIKLNRLKILQSTVFVWENKMFFLIIIISNGYNVLHKVLYNNLAVSLLSEN